LGGGDKNEFTLHRVKFIETIAGSSGGAIYI